MRLFRPPGVPGIEAGGVDLPAPDVGKGVAELDGVCTRSEAV